MDPKELEKDLEALTDDQLRALKRALERLHKRRRSEELSDDIKNYERAIGVLGNL